MRARHSLSGINPAGQAAFPMGISDGRSLR
jgi:hypothetical protein